MYKVFLAAIVLLASMPSWSKTATCTVEIWDYEENTKYIVEKLFDYPADPPGEHKYFKIPNSEHTCALGFYNLEMGTNLVCFLDDSKVYFVKSDRTGIKETAAKNNLIVKFNETNYGLKSSCI